MLDPVFNRTLFTIFCAGSHVEGMWKVLERSVGCKTLKGSSVYVQESGFRIQGLSRLKKPDAGSILG